MTSIPTYVLSSNLSMEAIGNISAQPIEEGIHLRWGFEAELGYPAYGFQLFRRPSMGKWNDICINVSPSQLTMLLQQGWISIENNFFRYTEGSCPKRSKIVSSEYTTFSAAQGPALCRRFDVELQHPILLYRVLLQGSHQWAMIIGMRQGKPVIASEISGDQTGTSLNPILVDSIIIYSISGGPKAICYVDPKQNTSGQWSENLLPVKDPKFGFGLPLTDNDYNLHHRFDNPANPGEGDLAEARERVRSTGCTLYPAGFADLRTSLSAMVSSTIPGRMFDREIFQTTDNASPFFERPLDLSLLFSLDPIMARVLGLYFVDKNIEKYHFYDYLLIGNWAAFQLSNPARVYSFAPIPEGTRIPRRFALGGVVIQLPTSSHISSYPRNSGKPCRKSLQVRQRSMFWFSSEPVRLRFNQPIRWILLELGSRKESLRVSMRHFGVEIGDASIPAGNDPISVFFEKNGDPINELVINGHDFNLYGFRTLNHSEAPVKPEELLKPVSLGTIIYHRQYIDSPPVPPPLNLRLRGVPMNTSEQLAETLIEAGPPILTNPQGLGMRWDPPPAMSISAWSEDIQQRIPTDAAAYQIRYQYLGNAATPAPIDQRNWTPAAKVPIAISPPGVHGEEPKIRHVTLGDDLCEIFPTKRPPKQNEFPLDADMWLQPWVPEGWYATSIQALDAFGRISIWADAGPVLADNITPPPPPLNVQAKLLQKNDPSLTGEEQAIVNSEGDGCIRVTWEWPAHIRRQAPHATHFRVYVKRRSFNHRRVRVTSVGPGSSPDLLSCTVESGEPLQANSLVGTSLIDLGTTPFAIVENTAGLVSNLKLKKHEADPSLIPSQGIAAISIVDHFPIKVLFANLAAVPDQLDCKIEGSIPLVANTLTGGMLTDRNQIAFQILSNSPGKISTLILKRQASDPSLLPAHGRAVLSISPALSLFENSAYVRTWDARVAKVDLTNAIEYEVTIPPVNIIPTSDHPVKYGNIGVTAADDSPRINDKFVQPIGSPWNASLAGLNGREGGVSAAVRIVAIYRQSLPEPPLPPRDRLYTSAPDFYGRAYYQLSWPNVEPARRSFTVWHVFRTTDRALFGLVDPDPAKSEININGLSNSARAEILQHYPAHTELISDDVIQQLANQPGAEQAFAKANAEPLRGSADQMVFADAVDGKNLVRYLYRLRTEDDGGNLSPLSPAGQPIYIPNTYPPSPVLVSGCTGGEGKVTLKWIPNQEPDLAGYIIFSTEADLTKDALEELRLLRRSIDVETGEIEGFDRDGNLIAPTQVVEKAQAEMLLTDGEVVLVREGLPRGQVIHYRLAAFDTAGWPSTLTKICTARTTGIERPAPPAWNDAILQADGLHLSWSSPLPDLNCLVQRSIDGQSWTNVTGWLGRGNYQAVDKGYQEGVTTYYRLRVTLPNGQTNKEFDLLTVQES